MLNSRTSVHESPCSPYILLGMRKEGRRSGCSPQGAQFSAMPPPAFSSLLSEFGAHPARLSRVSLPGIFSLSKSPRCLEVPALPGLERRAWLYRGRGLSWRGGAGRATGPGRRLEWLRRRAGRRDAAEIPVGVERSPDGCGAAGLRGGGSGAYGLHGASGVRLSSRGGSGRGFSSPWETCCPHTWMTRDASTSQVRTAQRHAGLGLRGAPRATPPPSLGRGGGPGESRPGAGRSRSDPCPSPILFSLSLGGPFRP